jgi:ferredoxin
VFLGITAVYALLTLGFGLSINWIWLLGALSLAGVILETTRMKFGIFPVVKVTRNADTCTSCRICDKVCPMAIKISDIPKVQHIDCHLCGDCVTSCPEPETLQFSKRKINWLPAVATVVLVALGLAFASVTDIPTISLKWGTSEQMDEAGIYQQSGLKSVKCFGSAMSFANHMKELPGVLGVEAFVSDFSVKVYFDKSVTDETKIRESIFTPVTRIIAAPSATIAEVSVSEFAVDQFFDPSDARMLSIRSSQHPGILAFETLFGEPVHTMIYYDAQLISEAKIRQMIEAKKVEWESDGNLFEAKTNFQVASVTSHEKMTQSQYLARMYEPVEMSFNGFKEYKPDQLDSLDLDFPGAADPSLSDMPWYLLSHVSNDKGVVRFQTHFTDSGIKLRLIFVPALTNRDKIIILLNQPDLDIHMSDGTKQVMKNPYHF